MLRKFQKNLGILQFLHFYISNQNVTLTEFFYKLDNFTIIRQLLNN